MTNTFPTFESKNEVECFKCGSTELEAGKESGYPRGAYKAFCPACSMFTFYDLLKAA